jgi:hypothetical protein
VETHQKIKKKVSILIIGLRLYNSSYTSKESLCKDITRLSKVSRYELKHLDTKKENSFVFVCSCISSHNQKKSKSRETVRGKAEKPNSVKNTNFKRSLILQTGKRKRTNSDACNFRLRFIFDPNNRNFKLHENSKGEHNHKPKIRLSIEVNKNSITIFKASKNLKFSLNFNN